MLNALLNIFFITVIFVFQTTILYAFTILDVRPDIILILTAFIGFSLGRDKGAITGFILGLIQDCLSNSLLGTNAFSKGVIGFIFGHLRNKIIFKNIYSQVIFVLLASFIDLVIILLISFLTNLDKEVLVTILKKLLLVSVYTSLVAPLLLQVFIFVSREKTVALSKIKRTQIQIIR